MKKYVKPELFYEHFELSTYIAACTFKPANNTDTQNCAFLNADTGIAFFTNNVLCEWKPDEFGSGNGGDCYFTGGSDSTTDGLGLFNS